MSNQAGIVPIIDVGAPTSTRKYQGWELVEVYFHGFERLITTTRGMPVHSPEFRSVGHSWQLLIYPGGARILDDGQIGVYLHHYSDENILVDFAVSVKTKTCKTKAQYVSDSKLFTGRGAASSGWGRTNFADRSKIIADLADGTLVVEVRLRKVEADSSSLMPFVAGNPLPKTTLDKFMDEETSDIAFEVGGHGSMGDAPKRAKTSTIFYAHRFIVQDWASNISELCNDATKQGPVPVQDVVPEIFRHLLHYSYGGKIDEGELKDNAKDIIDAADRYGVVGLKLEAEATFVTSTTITLDNAMDNLLYADSKNCSLLKEAVIDFLVENADEGIKKLSFDNFPGHLVKDLMTAFARGKKEESSSSDANDFSTMRVSKLRKTLHEKGLDIDGSRETMIARLEENTSNSDIVSVVL